MPHNMQGQNDKELDVDTAAASLGLATFLQDQLMPKGQPEATEGQVKPQEALGETVEPQEEAPQENETLETQ